jgi:phage/plasmid-like protein (TIGR03299 family)
MTETFAGRVPSWRKIGTVFNEHLTTSEMLHKAELSNWNVDKINLDKLLSSDYQSPNSLYATIRQDTNQVLGVVGSKYNVLQNEDAFRWADNILDGGGEWDTAGSFKNGSTVFGSLLIDKSSIVIDPNGINDKVDTFLLVSTSHDGSIPLQASITPMRVICQNTLNLALKTTPQTFKIRHTATAQARADVAREALNITFKYSQEFNALANQMYQTKITDDRFNNMIKVLYPKPESPKEGEIKYGYTQADNRWQQTVDMIWELRESPTNRDIKDTAWGALNIFTERLDWFRSGDDKDTKHVATAGFAPGSIHVNKERARILKTVLAMAN